MLLLPGAEEHVTMLLRDGNVESALEVLDKMQAAGDHRPHILRQIAELNADRGDIQKAIGAFEDYLRARPRDWDARAELAKLYLGAQRTEPYVAALETNLSLQPSTNLLHELIGFYRLNGRFDAEQRVLVRYMDSAFLKPRDLERAGALLAARSEYHAAAKALTLAERRAPPEDDSELLLLFDVLLRDGRENEAKDRALRWIAARRKAYLAAIFVEEFARLGHEPLALDLVREASGYVSNMEVAVTWYLAEKGYSRLAQRVLETWTERLDRAGDGELRQYVAAATAVGDTAGPVRLFLRLSAKREPQMLAVLTEEIAKAYGLTALAPLRPLLSYETLAARPVFGAELAVHDGSPVLARKLLENADLRTLDTEQRARWLVLLRQVEPDAEVFQRMSKLRRLQQLPPDMLPPLAQIALALGKTQDHDAIWESLNRTHN
jgi:tetratricopeptide (TPR) repeat protein